MQRYTQFLLDIFSGTCVRGVFAAFVCGRVRHRSVDRCAEWERREPAVSVWVELTD